MTACQRWAGDRDDCGGVVCRCLSRSVACRLWAPMDFAKASLCCFTPVVCCRSTGSTGSSGAAHCYLHRQDRPYPQWAHGGTDTPLNPWYHQCLKYNKHPERREYSKCPRAGVPSAAAEQLQSAHRILSTLRGPADPWVSRLAKQLEAVRPAPPAPLACDVQRPDVRTSGRSVQRAACSVSRGAGDAG